MAGYPLHQTDTGMENEIAPQKRCEIGERGKEGPCDNLTKIFSIAHMSFFLSSLVLPLSGCHGMILSLCPRVSLLPFRWWLSTQKLYAGYTRVYKMEVYFRQTRLCLWKCSTQLHIWPNVGTPELLASIQIRFCFRDMQGCMLMKSSFMMLFASTSCYCSKHRVILKVHSRTVCGAASQNPRIMPLDHERN